MKLLCPLCNVKTDVIHISKYKNENIIFDKKNLYQCQCCKIIFIHPMPTLDELDLYYKNDWQTSTDAEPTYQIQANERVKYLSRHIPLHGNMKVLDVGSGLGYLNDAFSNNGIDIDFYATDPNPNNLQKLKIKGIKAFSDLKEISERDFDLVTVCFVLEHISLPVEFMHSIMEYVKNGGYIFIDLPERDDTFKPVFDPHVVFYSAESLTNLANKLGLEVVHMTGYGRERSKLINEFNSKRNILKLLPALVSKILKKANELIYAGDRMDKKIKDLYEYYKFDEEGYDRWWIRTISRKPE